jgi:hypothetical protein
LGKYLFEMGDLGFDMIDFDNKGNIIPYDIIDCSLETLQEIFTFNNHREEIFEEYLSFCDAIKSLGIHEFYQFVDGSFVTKKMFPKDIDVVSFVDANFFNENAVRLLNLRDIFNRIDCFFVPVYSPNERNYFITQFGLFEWEQLFNANRENKPKGILKIIFN